MKYKFVINFAILKISEKKLSPLESARKLHSIKPKTKKVMLGTSDSFCAGGSQIGNLIVLKASYFFNVKKIGSKL